MSKLKSAPLVAGLLGVTLASQAFASVPVAQATIDWKSFSVQLFDLNTADGVDPYLLWMDKVSSASSPIPPYHEHDYGWTNVGFSDETYTVAAGANVVSALSNGYLSGSHSGTASNWGTFALSPYTMALFTVNGLVSVIDDADPNTQAEAYASLSITDRGPSGSGVQSSSTVFDLSGNRSGSLSGLMSASFVNLTGGEVYHVALSAGVRIGTTSPVPEPHTYGMLLAGLAVIPQVARRRRAI